jgi:hypothetical protein
MGIYANAVPLEAGGFLKELCPGWFQVGDEPMSILIFRSIAPENYMNIGCMRDKRCCLKIIRYGLPSGRELF